MKTGMCTIAFGDWDLEAALDLARKARFDGVEIWGKEPHISDAFDKGDLQTGLEAELDRANDALRIAKGLGTDLVRVWAGAEPSDAMSGEKRKEWVALWKPKDPLKRRGAIQETTIGMSHIRLMRARDLIEVTIEMLKEDQAAPLCDDPNCSRCMKPSQEITRAREAKEC